MKTSSVLICSMVMAFLMHWHAPIHLAGASETEINPTPKNVAVIVPFEGYSHGQFTKLKEAFEAADVHYRIVSTKIGQANVTPAGPWLQTELTIDQMNAADFDALVFLGGRAGIKAEYLDNPEAYRIVREADQRKMVIAAMCNAPAILAKAGVLQGRRVTSMGVTYIIQGGGGEVMYQNATIDGRFITATISGINELVEALVDALT